MTSRSTKNKSVMGDRTNACQMAGLTNKRLDLLLPSSKQLMLVNSSIKYYTGEGRKEKSDSKHRLESRAQPKKEQDEGKENDGALFGTQLKGALKRKEPAMIQGSKDKDSATQTSQDLDALLQTYKSLKVSASQHINKPFSAIQLPTFQQANQKNLTSLNNILPHERDPNKPKEESTSKEELMKRVDRLQKLVQDIINGKVVIHRKSKTQSNMKVTKPERTSIKVLEECTRKSKNRSVTWNAQASLEGSSKSLKSNKSKSRLRLQSAEDRKMLNIVKIPIINPKGFMIKKKNQLKLTPNYQPIREQSQEKVEARNIPKYITPIGQRSSQSSLYPKLRAKVLFVPNLINM